MSPEPHIRGEGRTTPEMVFLRRNHKYNQDNNRRIKIRQCKYLNNIIEQDHRRVKRITRSMLGFKSFRCAQSTLAGIGLMAMINKG